MNKISLYIMMVALLALFSCEDAYEQPYPVSDVKWYTSNPNATEYFVDQGSFLGFIDASIGELSHEWILEEGNNFLKKGFGPSDSLPTFIDNETGLVSTEKGINPYFGKAGRTTLRLKNTFPEKVTFNGVRPIEAVEKDGVWVIDTAFVIDVYGPIMPAYKVCRVVENPDGSLSPGDVILEVAADQEIDPENSDEWQTLEIEVGDRLMFIDLTVDAEEAFIQPDTRTWTISNAPQASVYEDSIAVAYFNLYGYTKSGLGSLMSSRTTSAAPKGSGRKIIPLNVEVIQSTKAFTYADGAVWTGAKSLAFNVTGEVADLGTSPELGFTVTVSNTAKGITNLNIPVSGVTFNPANATRINLDLGAEIYGNDVITVSFDDAGTNIMSLDDRPFVSFNAKTISIPSGGDNEFTDNGDYSGFELGGAGLNAAYCPTYWVGGQDAANPEWARVITKQFTGEASMKYNGTVTPTRTSCSWMHVQRGIEIEAGAYEVSHKIFIETGSTIEHIRTTLAPKAGGWPTEVGLLWDLKDLKRGEWHTLSQIASFPNAIGADQYRYSYIVQGSDNTGVTGDQTFYLDDFEIRAAEAGVRP